jgi:hypothetical protein
MRATFIALLAAGVLLAGCDNKPNKSVSIKGGDGSSVSFSAGDNGVILHASDGKSSVDINTAGLGSAAKLPDFLSLYPGGKVMLSVMGADAANSVGAKDDDTKNGGIVAFRADAAPSAVIAFYKARAEAAGFAENRDREREHEKDDAIAYAADDNSNGEHFKVVVEKKSDGTNVVLAWSER